MRFHPKQNQLWRTQAKFINVVAGRGSGKTELTRRRQVRYLPVKYPGLEQPLHGYALPTFNQARRVAWEPILRLIPRKWISKIRESEMSVETVFGSKLYILGLDKPERAEGVQWSTFVIDESCDQKAGVFDKSILPALSHNCDWCARIGVPKRTGPGAIEFRAAWERGFSDPNSLSLHWPSSDIVTADVLDWARTNLSPQDYKEQYDGDWLTMSGGVYFAFDKEGNTSTSCVYRRNQPIIVGMDFNVDPMAWVIGHMIDGQVFIFDEIYIHNTNTRRSLDALAEKYGEHKAGWFFTGDASSRARKTSADLTDYAQIYADTRFENSQVIFPQANPSIHTRIATVNAAFLNANEERRLFISESCENLIRDLAVGYKPGTREIDDNKGKMGHITDALGYLLMYFLPIQIETSDQQAIYAR